jgi:hypothetical protein
MISKMPTVHFTSGEDPGPHSQPELKARKHHGECVVTSCTSMRLAHTQGVGASPTQTAQPQIDATDSAGSNRKGEKGFQSCLAKIYR